MFKPEKMLYTGILLLEDDVNSITRLLAAQASFHLTDRRPALATETLKKRDKDSGLADKCRQQANHADNLLRRVGLYDLKISSSQRDKILRLDSGELLQQSERVLKSIREEIESFIKTRNIIQSQITRLKSIANEMYLLHKYHLSFEDITSFKHFFTEYGIIDRDGLDLVRRKITSFACHLLVMPIAGRQTSLLLIGDKDHFQEFTESLAEAGFHHHDIPERYRKSFDQSLDIIEAELWQLRDNLAEQNGVFFKNRDRWQAELSYWKNALTIHSHILKAMEKFGCDGPVNQIVGFVPESKYKTLIASLEKNAPERYFLSSFSAEQIPETDTPTRLKNPSFFRPFEMFVETYGLPGYKDIDPTPVVGLSFLLMFGMMFGDVGHGAVLAIFGLLATFLPYQIFVPIRSLGKILTYAGFSSMIFGFLFGSFFGIEEDSVLPALWMRPSHRENLIAFLAVAIGIGVIIITLGIILNIVQMIKKKKIQQALLGPWSVASLSFYWMLLTLMIFYAGGKSIALPTGFLAGIMVLPLLLIVVSQIVFHFKSAHNKRENEEDESDLATIFFEPIEIIMNLFTNTVSFMRVAAFGLAHAALMMATFIIKDMIPFTGANIVSLPIEHLFIIILEGMIATIQCLRLEYYEFFSKFFIGGGIKYSPLTAENN